MPRYAHQADVHGTDVERHLADRLCAIAVEQGARGAADRADLGERLDNADLVVDRHDRDRDGALIDQRCERGEVDQAAVVDRRPGEHEALALEALAGFDDAFVLGRHADDLVALALVDVALEIGGALERQVVRFGRARGEDDLARLGADQRGDLGARRLDRVGRLGAEGVAHRMGIAELLCEVGQHAVDDARVGRRRRLIVEIDRQ